MTCVVALKDVDGSIIMGADSAGVGGYSLQNRLDRKIYRNGAFLLGFTTSFRMGQLLGYSLDPPRFHATDYPGQEPSKALERFMVTKFVDAVRACLKAGGFAGRVNEVESAGQFLVAFAGEIFMIDNDYQVARQGQDYAAAGCGFDIALGSLWTTGLETTAGAAKLAATERVRIALEASERFSAGVRAPFYFEVLTP